MSRASTKTAGRSSKSTAGARKKTAKSARKSVKKASASASRRAAGKTTRPRTVAVTRKSTSTKPAAKQQSAAKPSATKLSAAKEAPKTVTSASVMLVAAEAMMIRTASPPVQPAAPDVPVYPHRYRVGEIVYYTSPSFGRAAANGSYTVVKLLPSDGDDYQYRIKSSGEAFERVAKESQLDRV